jgi:hypothetical protein
MEAHAGVLFRPGFKRIARLRGGGTAGQKNDGNAEQQSEHFIPPHGLSMVRMGEEGSGARGAREGGVVADHEKFALHANVQSRVSKLSCPPSTAKTKPTRSKPHLLGRVGVADNSP